MALIKCKMCGGDLRIEEDSTVCECEYCGTRQTVPSADNEKKLTLFSRAGRLLRGCEFDKAAGVFEAIVADFPEEAEAYWGLVLCKYGIEYVDDPATGKKIPTCHRSSFDSVLDDPNFEQACENTDALARRVYRDEARQIEDLRKRIIEVSGKEEPYDVFISYKETDENGDRTLDSVIAQDIYTELTEKGYRVFFSRISLEDKLGTEYEPFIFAALNSAKVMLIVGTDYENFDSVWVKNEWSRFLKLIASGQKKTLIPVFKNMDAYDMPKEFAKLAAQDMGKVGAMQDLIRGVEKLIGKTEIAKETIIYHGEGYLKTAAAVKRGFLSLESGEFNKAKEYFEQALTLDAECAEAYWGLVLASTECRSDDKYITEACQQNGTTETLYVPVATKTIEEAIKLYAVKGYLDEETIRSLFSFDLSYSSKLKSQRQIAQEEKHFFETDRNIALAYRFADGETAKRLSKFKQQLYDGLEKSIGYEEEQEIRARNEKTLAYNDHLKNATEKANALHKKALYRRNLKRRLFLVACCFVICVIASYAVNANVVTPMRDYRAAVNLYKNGYYNEAFESFQKLNDYEKVMKFYVKRAQLGDAEAIRRVGMLYGKGLGVEQNYEEAMDWFLKAANAGDGKAMSNIGIYYLQGYGVKQDYDKAMEWFLKAADAGDSNGMLDIGIMYLDGYGVKKDYTLALEWKMKAAELGNADAMNSIGQQYHNGQGVKQDFKKAMEWYLKAADAGSTKAMLNIGILYEFGRGMEPDKELAYAWYKKALDAGDDNAALLIEKKK